MLMHLQAARLLLLVALVLEPREEHAAQAERCREDEYIARHAPVLPAGCTATGSLHERDVGVGALCSAGPPRALVADRRGG